MKNPYLIEGRLPDIIAALTAMGAYKFYKLDFDSWANRISGPSKSGGHWRQVFESHPEFFRLNQEETKASLVWRRTFPRNFDVDNESEIQPDHQLSGQKYDRISRRPLAPDEIQALISVAVELHERALEQHKASLLRSPFISGILALIGAVVGGLLSGSWL